MEIDDQFNLFPIDFIPDEFLLKSFEEFDSLFDEILSVNDVRLEFVNPPEPIYHVRYFSEIDRISAPEKKHVSARYLRGVRARHVTIAVSVVFHEEFRSMICFCTF